MKVQIFDVEHGACALVTADTGAHMLIDCGHNSTTGWRPSTYLPSIGVTHLDELVITNYDEDHVSDLPYLVRSVGIGILTRNPTAAQAPAFTTWHK
jgi:beta-lactamase superfamily II metal-dependent hydrolase